SSILILQRPGRLKPLYAQSHHGGGNTRANSEIILFSMWLLLSWPLEVRIRCMNNDAVTPGILNESAVTVFFNPTAGGGRAGFRLAQVQKLIESFQVHAQFVKTNSAAELELSVQEAISRRCRVLIAMGGDGTFQALANAAFGADVLLGVLPVGAGNDFAAA